MKAEPSRLTLSKLATSLELLIGRFLVQLTELRRERLSQSSRPARMTIKYWVSARRINSTVNRRFTWLRLFQWINTNSKARQLTCSMIYCANTLPWTNKFTYQVEGSTRLGYWVFVIKKLAVAVSRIWSISRKAKIVSKIIVDPNCILCRAWRHETEKTTYRSQLLRHNRTDPV